MEREKELVQAQFGRTAERYVSSPGHASGCDLDEMVHWLEPQSEWIALDVATGGGHTAKALAPHVRSVIASDLTERMLDAARSHLTKTDVHNVLFVLADAEALPFLPESFDVVTCRIAAHHFPHPERFVREVRRVLKPGGRFVLIDNVSPSEVHLAAFLNEFESLRDESHVRCLSTDEWKNLFANVGLSVERELMTASTFEFQPWVRRMADTDEQASLVESTLLAANADCRERFAIEVVDGRVQSLRVDRWMVLLRR